MFLYHIVLVKVKPDTSQEALAALSSNIRQLAMVLPSICEISFGPAESKIYEGFVDRTQGYTHALFVKLKSKADLEAYNNHELHQKVRAQIGEIKEDVLAFDFCDRPSKHYKPCWYKKMTIRALWIGAGAAAVAAAVKYFWKPQASKSN
eukprot:TRINITY_DN3092_c0_g1_i3.p2 TRINITY_DN3092_c0_g1~~TRINITY_DN3092_c0_g1_i3.p2  ORF type:complete len:149 (+),score=40.44 TRINITY_DN3092_c0_g1_i3:88-534(+)